MRILSVLIGAAALFALAAPAAAASRADWDACKGDDPDRSIAACTRIIQGRSESAKDSAIAHHERALSYKSKGDFDRAIADLSEAIRLDPKYAEAYYLRLYAKDEAVRLFRLAASGCAKDVEEGF